MGNYYKRIEKRSVYFDNAPTALKNSYDKMKAEKGVIVSNDECGEFILVPTEKVDEFIITAVSRQDVMSRGFNADELTDEDMQEIADTLAKDFTEFGSYWDTLDTECESRGLVQDESAFDNDAD